MRNAFDIGREADAPADGKASRLGLYAFLCVQRAIDLAADQLPFTAISSLEGQVRLPPSLSNLSSTCVQFAHVVRAHAHAHAHVRHARVFRRVTQRAPVLAS